MIFMFKAGIFVYRRSIEMTFKPVVEFLKPELFDVLVYASIVVGIIAAAVRISRDFRSGPRWPEANESSASEVQPEGSPLETSQTETSEMKARQSEVNPPVMADTPPPADTADTADTGDTDHA